MKTIKLNSEGTDVELLQKLLNEWGFEVSISGKFDIETKKAVLNFQVFNKLAADGIVGKKSWAILQNKQQQELAQTRLKQVDFTRAANALNVEVAAIKAVQEVETGGRGGFFAPKKPAILFEGHIFWNQLKKVGKDPEGLIKGNENIIYPKWSKSHYAGGIREYDRLDKAIKIDEAAAKKSTSWGLFQIMGFNYEICGCKNVDEFVSYMTENEGKQLDLFVKFLQGNGWDKYLQALDWKEFARHYNGPAYAKNKYDELLKKAYLKYR